MTAGSASESDGLGLSSEEGSPRSNAPEQEDDAGKELSDRDLLDYARSLGLDLDSAADGDLKWLVQEAFAAPLPANWTEHVDEEGRVYFFNQLKQESRWLHPSDEVFRELIEIIKDSRQSPPDGGIDSLCADTMQAHLEKVHSRALQQLDGWSGPYTSTAGQYFYNAKHDYSSWDNPVDEWNAELALRQRVLSRCFQLNGSVGQQSEELRPSLCRPVSVEPLLELPRLPLASPVGSAEGGPKTPSSTRSFATARSARSVRSIPSARSPSARLLGSPREELEDIEQADPIAKATPGDYHHHAANISLGKHGTKSNGVIGAAGEQQHPPPSRSRGDHPHVSHDDEDAFEVTFGNTQALDLPKFGT